MKHTFITTIILALALLVAGCGGADAEEETQVEAPVIEDTTPDAPVEETVEETAPGAATGQTNVVDSSGALGGGEMADLGSKIGEVACDLEERKITFTFENTGELLWNIDGQAPFVSTEEKNVKIFINKYEANKKSPQFHPDTGERMFGPSETFSENCGGVSTLAPGEAATCTLYPVKLNRGTGSEGLSAVNHIFIDSPSIDDQIEFTC